MKTIRAVTLDVGGTLIEPWPSVGHVYAEVAHSFGYSRIEPAQLSEAFVRAWQSRERFDYSRSAWRDVVRKTFSAATGCSISDPCFDEIYARFGRAGAWRVYDDVRPFLELAASRGVCLGLVSNWDERLRGLLAELNLLASFNAVIISHDVGFHKPAREIFHQATKQLGVAPEELMHVGDSDSEDFRGAQLAGLQSRWLRRDGAKGPGIIHTLVEILGQ